MLKLTLLIGGALLAPLGLAQQITLTNGDVIEGQLKSVDAEAVIWRSEHFGELRIPKTRIERLESETELKLRGKTVPCQWRSLVNQRVTFECADGDRLRVPLLSLQQVVPFEGHAASIYSYEGRLSLAGSKQTGNTRSEFWQLASDVRLRHLDWRHNVRLNLNGQSLRSQTAAGEEVITRTRKGRATYGLDWFFQPQWFWVNRLGVERDDNRNIQEEYIYGSGLGHQFWETNRSALALEAGLQYTRRYLQVPRPGLENPQEYGSVRLAADYRYKFDLGVQLFHKSELTHALKDPERGADRWEFNSDTGMSFPIFYSISGEMSLRWNYVNDARTLDPNASRTDAIYRVGVNYSW